MWVVTLRNESKYFFWMEKKIKEKCVTRKYFNSALTPWLWNEKYLQISCYSLPISMLFMALVHLNCIVNPNVILFSFEYWKTASENFNLLHLQYIVQKGPCSHYKTVLLHSPWFGQELRLLFYMFSAYLCEFPLGSLVSPNNKRVDGLAILNCS